MSGRRAQRPLPRSSALWYGIPIVFFLSAAVAWVLALVAWIEPKPLYAIHTPEGVELPPQWYQPEQRFWVGVACFLMGLGVTVVLAVVRRRGKA
ncbi:hypothetical protein [Microtetraspora malaysiensis]|uniref:hypothetical protein n=1 Tax=Microtetraspora malaysiensis TaxID=161358 RepID=UPI00082AC1B3|nr:hypothetical protein [Microtetraspora malaysiensis]